MAFKKAIRSQIKLRMSIAGPSGSGKTWTALTLAQLLAREQAEAVAEAEALLSSESDEDDAEYEEWKRAHGFDQPMSREEYADYFDVHGFNL